MDFKAWRKRKYPMADIEMVGDHLVIVYFDNPPVNAVSRERIQETEPLVFEGIFQRTV